MTLRHLMIFSTVCRLGSITQAAEELNMAQPSVSLAIRELESYYGIRLFERMHRRLYITEAGERLYGYANSILTQCKEAKEELRDMHGYMKLKIGINVSFGAGEMTDMILGFRKAYPEVPVYVMVSNSSQIEDKLLENRLDLGIIDYPENSMMFHSRCLKTDPMVAACSLEFFEQRFNMLKKEDMIPLDMLDKIPLLVREEGSGSREKVEAFYKKNCIKMNIEMESVDIQCLVKMAASGLGVTFLPKEVLKQHIDEKRLIILTLPEIEEPREYYMVFHKSKYMTKSMKRFQEFAEAWYS